MNFEVIDNLFQVSMLAAAAIAAIVLTIRYQERRFMILAFAYASFLMGTLYWVLYLAIIGNVLVYKLHLGTDACQPGDNLSMFYLSPYYPTQFPLLGVVQEFSYPLFVLTYIAIFTGLSLLVWKVANIAWKHVKTKV